MALLKKALACLLYSGSHNPNAKTQKPHLCLMRRALSCVN